MFIIFLKFSANKDQMKDHLDAHKIWLKEGFDDGIFHLAGSLDEGQGGGIISLLDDKEALMDYLTKDPFVIHDVVTVDITGLKPSLAAEDLKVMMDDYLLVAH